MIGLTLSPAPARWTASGRFETLAWDALVARFATPELWPASEAIGTSEAQLPGWSFARYRDDARFASRDPVIAARETAGRVTEVHGLVAEYVDEPSADAEAISRWWHGITFAACTSAFHEVAWGERPPGPRWRVLVPFATPTSPAEAAGVARWARHPRRRAGVVDPSTEDVSRVVALPAINPGHYRWAAQAGEPLEPAAALTQLARWEAEDRREAAERVVAGTSTRDAVGALAATLAQRSRHPLFAWPGAEPGLPGGAMAGAGALEVAPRPAWVALERVAGALWPGRTVAVATFDPRLRSAFSLAVAEGMAAAGHAVLLATPQVSASDLAARLVALRAAGPASPEAILARSWSAAEVAGAAERLVADCPRLRLWSPARDQRDGDALARFLRAFVEVCDHRCPVVVLDPLDAWTGLDALLWDVARPGAISPDWPGAALIVGASASDPALASSRALEAAFAADASGVAERVAGSLGPLGAGAALVLGLAADPGGATRRTSVAILRNAEGETALDTFDWQVASGRLVER